MSVERADTRSSSYGAQSSYNITALPLLMALQLVLTLYYYIQTVQLLSSLTSCSPLLCFIFAKIVQTPPAKLIIKLILWKFFACIVCIFCSIELIYFYQTAAVLLDCTIVLHLFLY